MKRSRLGLALALCLLCVAALALLTPGAPFSRSAILPSSRTFLIATDFGSAQISVYQLIAGIPHEVAGSPFTTGLGPELMAVDPTNHRLYVANSSVNSISGYHITDADGFGLQPLPGSPFLSPDLAYPYGLAANFSNDVLYASNFTASSISGFRIDPANGALKALPDSPFLTGANPYQIALDLPDGFLYAPSYTGTTISGFAVNRDSGELQPLPGSPFAGGNGPAGIAIDSQHHLLYATDEFDANFWVYLIDPATGNLTPAAGSPVATVSSSYGVALQHNGSLVYAVSYGGNNVSAYHVNTQTGHLTQVAGSPFPVGAFPISMVIDPTGEFAYVSNRDASTISAFRIGPSGALRPLPGSPFPAGPSVWDLITVTLP
jgi:6-phosphogluconolactonase